ncbi:hypothetical protein FZU01_22585 [Salmonella enterica subsp. enterica]|nr:hypothetical protein [Salmonella enterica subsp. enterica serovar Kintambo]ECV5098610.1 hypothetical protein [Salmonella enterica subsp. enterica serovar Kintambo]
MAAGARQSGADNAGAGLARAAYRIPVGCGQLSSDGHYITETKNQNSMYLSSQLKDDIAYVTRSGMPGRVDLIIDQRTKINITLLREHLAPGSLLHIIVTDLNK